MCMSGSNNSRNLRSGQLATAQRSISTSSPVVTPGAPRKIKVKGGFLGLKKKTVKIPGDPVVTMEPDAQQRIATPDGAQARIRSRMVRSGVANARQSSAFSSRRPRTGNLRIDGAGAQVAG